jgi:hypothetical protein
VRDSSGIEVVSNDLVRLEATCPLAEEPTVVIGTGQSEEQQLYRVFGATRLTDGTIALVNQGSQELRFYDQEGQFLRAAGRAGEGPGEFRDAFYIWKASGDTLWVGDYRPWRFNVFSPEGAFVRTVSPRPTYPNSPGVISVLEDGRSVLASRPTARRDGPGFELRYSTVVLHAADGQLQDTLGTFPNGRWGTVEDDPNAMGLNPHFESFMRTDARRMTVALGQGSEPQVLVYDASEPWRLERIIRWADEDRTISREDIEEANRALMDRYADMDPGMRARLVDPLVSDRRPVADLFPALADVRVGDDGSIWVQEYRRPSDEAGYRWMVFDREGGFRCRVSMPEFRGVLEVSDDYVLVLYRDALDVEQVWQLSLDAPRAEPS